MAVWYPDLVSIPLRIVLGILFAVHGHPKLFKEFKGTAKFLKGIGFRPPAFWAAVLGVTEFFGGLALLLGFATRVAAALLIIAMLVALYFNAFKWKKPFKGGYEFDLLLIAGLLTLLLLGAGPISIDAMLGWTLG